MTPARLGRTVATLRAAGCVFAEDEAELLTAHAGTEAELDALVARRAGGEPLEHILGWAEFCGLRVGVDAAVFVPRRRTEFLVELAATATPRRGVVVDLCCGSGAIGLALLTRRPDLRLHAADLDPEAVACARRNLGPRAEVHSGDLYAALPAALAATVDVMVVNAPYVPTSEIALMPAEAREHERRLALDGGLDGLRVARRITSGAAHWLRSGGQLLIETSRSQAARLADIMREDGLTATVRTSDEFDATVVIGRASG